MRKRNLFRTRQNTYVYCRYPQGVYKVRQLRILIGNVVDTSDKSCLQIMCDWGILFSLGYIFILLLLQLIKSKFHKLILKAIGGKKKAITGILFYCRAVFLLSFLRFFIQAYLCISDRLRITKTN